MWQTGQRITRDPHRNAKHDSRSSQAERTKTPSHETSSVTLEDRSRLVKHRNTRSQDRLLLSWKPLGSFVPIL